MSISQERRQNIIISLKKALRKTENLKGNHKAIRDLKNEIEFLIKYVKTASDKQLTFLLEGPTLRYDHLDDAASTILHELGQDFEQQGESRLVEISEFIALSFRVRMARPALKGIRAFLSKIEIIFN